MNKKRQPLLACLAVLIVGLGMMSPPRACASGLYALWEGGTSFLSSLTLAASGGTYSTVAANVGDGSYTIVQNGTVLYILAYTSNAIYTVNTVTGAVGTISVGNLSPWDGAVSPDGETLYFSTYDGTDIYALDLSTGAVTAVPLTSFGYAQYPQQVVIGPHGQHLYVAEAYGGASEYGAVEQIDLATNTVTKTYDFYSYYYGSNVASAVLSADDEKVFYPTGLALSPDGSTLYVASASYDNPSSTYDGALSVINVQTGELENVIPDPDAGSTDYFYYSNVVVDPASGWVYATYDLGSSVLTYDPATQQGSLVVTSAMTDPLAMAFGHQDNVLYVGNNAAVSGSTTVSVSTIDTNPADTTFNTVIGTVPATTATTQSGNSLWSIAYVHLLAVSTVTSEAPAGPTSGNLSSSVQNATGCAVTYSVLTPPATGSVSLQSSTGAWTLTPSLADLGASLSFVYKVSTVSSCPSSQAATATGTVTVAWEPSFGPVPSATVGAGTVSGPVDFNVYSPVPVTFSVTSSNPSVVSANGVLFPASCQGSCDLYVRGDNPGVATVTLTATTAAGASSTTTFQVTVTGSSSGSGGTGGLGPLTLLLLGLLGALGVRRKKAPVSRG